MKVKARLLAALGKPEAAVSDASDASGLLAGIEAAIIQGTTSGSDDDDGANKYIHEILFLVSNSPGSIGHLSRGLSRRLGSARDPSVAVRSLLMLHRLIRAGDRYFEEDLRRASASGDLRLAAPRFRHWRDNNHHLNLSLFSISYSELLKERIEWWFINQSGKLETIRPPEFSPSSDEGSPELVLHRLARCQAFLDRAMDCVVTPIGRPSSNRAMSSAMRILLRESFLVHVSFVENMEMIMAAGELEKPLRCLVSEVMRKMKVQIPAVREFFEFCKASGHVGKLLEYPAIGVVEVAGGGAKTETMMKDGDDGGGGGGFEMGFENKMETEIRTEWVVFDEDSSR